MNFQVARIIGPGIGGIMIGLVGTKYTILISTIFFLPALITLSLIKLAPKNSEKKSKDSMFLDELYYVVKVAYQHFIIL